MQLKISIIPNLHSVCSDPVYERGYLIVRAHLHGIKIRLLTYRYALCGNGEESKLYGSGDLILFTQISKCPFYVYTHPHVLV